jgi:hypothetical protein
MLKYISIGFILVSTSAFADEVKVSPLNCDTLNGTTYVCVQNLTSKDIVDISCDGHLFGTTTINLPRGMIPSGGSAVINFKSGACSSGIHVRTDDGKLHTITGQDVSSLTILPITDKHQAW